MHWLIQQVRNKFCGHQYLLISIACIEMLTTLHIILTYKCALRCKHCYVYSSPRATGNISLSQISTLLFECRKLPEIKRIYFDGGEPFKQYPLLLKAIHKARALGFKVTVGTNGYFARTVEAGLRFLRPLAEMGVKEICISNDPMHYLNPKSSPARRALQAARKLGMHTILSRITEPEVINDKNNGFNSATELKEPRLMYAGRAAESLVEGLPSYGWQTFTECPRKDLSDPEKVYIDTYGYVQICPGIAIGNAWERPLHRIIQEFNPIKHPVIGPLFNAGPVGLIQVSGVQPDDEYVEPCHSCYSTRRNLIERYPHLLAPRNVYGL